MAGKGRIAAPLLGGVRGWVYLHETNHQGITAREIDRKIESAGIKMGRNAGTLVRESTAMR